MDFLKGQWALYLGNENKSDTFRLETSSEILFFSARTFLFSQDVASTILNLSCDTTPTTPYYFVIKLFIANINEIFPS